MLIIIAKNILTLPIWTTRLWRNTGMRLDIKRGAMLQLRMQMVILNYSAKLQGSRTVFKLLYLPV